MKLLPPAIASMGGALAGCGAQADPAVTPPGNPAEHVAAAAATEPTAVQSLEWLRARNKRFVEGHLLHPHVHPAVETAKGQQGDLAMNAVRQNVRKVVRQIEHSKPVLAEMVQSGRLKIVGAVYHLDSGEVVMGEAK